MGKPTKPDPVKLIASMFSNDEELFLLAESRLRGEYGPADYRSALLPFDHTDYYAREFGSELRRQFLSFERLIDPGELADVKLFTNGIEMALAEDGKRRINVDPGYISLAKLVLATTKNRSHRIYLGKGIYAEVTLRYERQGFRSWEYTYPDFRTPEYLRIMEDIRDIYLAQRRHPQADAAR